jgi:hypothetical protein
VAAAVLLFTGRCPRGLFDLLVGIARWALRVIAFVALLTEMYPLSGLVDRADFRFSVE